MKKLSLALSLVAALFLSFKGSSQTWVDMMTDPNTNFYTLQQEFNQYWANRPIERGKGYKIFKRYEWFAAQRVYPSGDRKLASRSKAYQEFQQYLNTMGPMPLSMPGTWTPLGPSGAPSNGGAGRINFVRFDPVNTSIVYVGSPAGGLWKSINGGTSWTTTTDALSVIGCSDLAIDPTNSNILYLATGDRDAADTYSIGILKSTDGGVTWNTTGLTWTVNQGRTISKLLIHPTNPSILIAGTSNGIYRSTNGGANWTQVATAGGIMDLEYKPGDPNTVYASSTRFYKSVDGGVTFTQVTTGLPANTSVNRLAIAVSAANPAYVYILAGSQSNSGYYGVYRSTDSGATFTTRSTTPNVLGWQSNGSDTGGQSWYDLAIAASPTNADVVVVGGVNIWRSTNGGTNWTINGHWTGTGAPYVHADVHDLIFLPGNGTTYWAGCDGGVFRTTNSGTGWSDMSANLQIAQMYRLGMSTSNAGLVLSGHQDNGTNRMNGTTWAQVIGGDGMECFIDRTNNNVMYGELYNGDFYRSTNGGANWSNIVSGLTGNANWVTPWCQDPVTANTIYAGYSQVFKSTNQGTAWTQLGTITGTGTIIALDVAPSNTQVIYAARQGSIFKTTNGGTNWTNITGTLPVASAVITYIEIDPTDANNVWVTFSGYSSGNKVFVTTNGGTSWTNFSTGLPNLPVNCIVYQNGTQDGVYVGTDVGVYYRDNTYASWQPYFTGLPNVIVKELEIYYATGKLRAATFGRGMWETDVFTAGSMPPAADFNVSQSSICPNMTVQFTDMSSLNPTGWSWSFPGGTPATSTLQNPTVTYPTSGTYNVTLTATNANGSDVETKSAYIVVSGTQVLPLTEGFQNTTFVPANWGLVDAGADLEVWTRVTGVGGFSVASTAACARFDNYNPDVTNTRDELHTPKYNFSNLSSASLTFDVAYSQYDNTYSDSLYVYISTNCGSTWTQIYMKGGSTLGTAPNQTASAFVPTATQWRTETVSLTPYVGQNNVLVKFQNRSHWGQMLYLDNINITGVVAAGPIASFTASSSAVCAGSSVTFTNTSTGSPTSYNWTFTGGSPASSTTQNPPAVTYATAGTYTVTLVATNANGSNTSTSTVTVNANPTVAATAQSASVCAGSSTALTASGAATYSWMPGSGTGTSITVTPASTTTYTVTGTSAAGCTNTASVTVTVNTLPTVTAAGGSAICPGSSAALTANGASTYSWMPGSLTGTTVTVTPTATTTYTVTGTAANGCTNTANVTVTVNTLPAVAASGTTSICNGNPATLTASGATSYSWMPGSMTGASITVNPASTTTYTVTGTAANGCTNTATITVNVGSTPTVAAAAQNAAICSGASTTLTATGAVTYSWMPGSMTGSSITVSPTATTTYTVTGTNASGCTNTSTVTVTVNPSPAAPSITQSGNTLTSTVTGASYQWYLNGSPVSGATSQSYTAAQNGNYTVEVIDANGCGTTSASLTVTVTGVAELIALDAFIVYPNPNEGTFEVSFNVSVTGNYTLELRNVLGQLVYIEKLDHFTGEYKRKIDISTYGKGIYTVSLTNEEKASVKKVVVY
jgi:PKD repeat protein